MKEETSSDVLKLLQSWLPILTVAAAALWTVYTYNDQQKAAALLGNEQSKREASLRLFEAQKPFLDKQLALYFETSEIVGRLVTIPITDPRWASDERRFWALYWSELTMVEQGEVAQAMVAFGRSLTAYQATVNDTTKTALRNASLDLAHTIGRSIKSRWTEQIH